MAIIRFTNSYNNVPEGAQNVKFIEPGFNIHSEPEDTFTRSFGPYCNITWEENIGLCLVDYERNGYDDSDFHMIVWNEEENKPEDICYATTRGWTYPSYGSYVDATPEIQAKYDAYVAERERQRRIYSKLEERATLKKIARGMEIDNYTKLRKLQYAYNKEDWARLKGFLQIRIRSNFKISLKNQIATWVKEENNKYPTPLSRKQMQYI